MLNSCKRATVNKMMTIFDKLFEIHVFQMKVIVVPRLEIEIEYN